MEELTEEQTQKFTNHICAKTDEALLKQLTDAQNKYIEDLRTAYKDGSLHIDEVEKATKDLYRNSDGLPVVYDLDFLIDGNNHVLFPENMISNYEKIFEYHAENKSFENALPALRREYCGINL